jgi:hypothetical protein
MREVLVNSRLRFLIDLERGINVFKVSRRYKSIKEFILDILKSKIGSIYDVIISLIIRMAI